MERSLTVARFAALAALLYVGCDQGPVHVGDACVSSATCPDGQRCIESVCQVVSTPDTDAGVAPNCGALNQACCGTTCSSGLFCSNNVCIRPAATDVGQPCQVATDCSSGLCIDLGSGARACSAPCTAPTECVSGWTCQSLSTGGGVCQCTTSAEVCDGRDNDCNGVVDDGTSPDTQCEESAGPGATCQSGACFCPNKCDGQCVDFATNDANCGRCGNACSADSSCQSGTCACNAGLIECSDSCVDTMTDSANCGTCGLACPSGTTCIQGGCECPEEQTLCASVCQDTRNDPMNCGDCDAMCPAGASCIAGQCACPAGQLACDGVCIAESVRNCGTCGRSCPAAHDTPTCSAGACLIRSCEDGYQDCNTNVNDGCEIYVRNDSSNCGACNNQCMGGTVCLSGSCVCPSGTSLCNGSCIDLSEDNANCGGCGNVCPVGAQCVAGGCQCPPGSIACSGRCVDTSTDTANCGACSTTCDQGGSCVEGHCGCPDGTVSCDGRCTPDLADITNCGACHQTCTTSHGTPACAGGACGIASCATGFDNCNGSVTDGCEASLQTDRNNCGACGNICAAATSCVAGQCKCPGTRTLCGNTCVDLANDASNCSACGTVCPSGAICSAGGCTCATGSLVCNGACTSVTNDVNNCGSCGNVCATGSSCVAGQCTCPSGKFACHGTCIASDVNNCGVCDNACSAANGTPACVNRTCTVASCHNGFQDCDHVVSNGCETNTTNTLENCGACGAICSGANVVGSTCSGSQCTGTCVEGHADCNRNLQSDGCEIDLDSDINNCGACGNVCDGANLGNIACIGGQCVGMCLPNYLDCNLQSGDGCEVASRTDPNNCGSCGAICSAQNMATRTCGDGECNGSCKSGFADCNDNLLGDGCEINTQTDLANCGSCSAGCSGSHVLNSACSAGSCTGTCASGFANCDGNLRSNGCERNTSSDTANCGGCDVICSGAHVNGSACTNGACTGTCAPGYTDCNNNKQLDGCEKNTDSDPNNCGGCGIKCSTNHVNGSACVSGVCVGSCQPGYTNCNGNLQSDGCETTTSSDVNNCGACGTVCAGTNMTSSVCSAGACTGTCRTGFVNCNDNLQVDGCETNTLNDPNNCGSCGSTCSGLNVSNPTCTNGTCAGTCATNYSNCNSDLRTDGCEINTGSDLANCGGCGSTCNLQNVSNPACQSGACSGSCQTGYANCDNNLRTNGCETNTTSSLNNCGGCGVTCSGYKVNGSTCSSGSCAGTCQTGYANCNNNLQSDGCEVSITNDANNCGGCGVACSSNHLGNRACTNSACGGTCFTGYADCNGNKQSDGCEASLFTDPDNCGSCGRVCPGGAHITVRTCANPGTCGATCDQGFADCDNNKATNGCESDLSSPDSCGTCGNVCSGNHVSTRTCTSGDCGGTCSTGYADCNNAIGVDGCETSIFSNVSNCGGCGVVCSANHINTVSCSATGVCNGACSTGYGDCNSNRQTDGCETSIFGNVNNCGACGNVCSSNHITPACSASGVCNGTCSTGFADCNGNKLSDGCEINTNTDTSNCGGCGTVCSTNHVNNSACSSGACTGTCATGYLNCYNGLQYDGCETNSLTDRTNCGGCGIVCSTNHLSGSTCSAGSCAGTCATGYKDCYNGLQYDGCETYTDGDASNCGACGNVCPSSAPYCSTGSCYCPANYLVCGGSCIAQSATNCGACDSACSTNHISPTCSSGQCGGTCASGYADCNSDKRSDGCETSITTTTNCGGCGITCGSGQVCSAGACIVPPGQAEYTTPGTFFWTAPAGVTSVSVVVIGGGGGGDGSYGSGGGGGALAYGNSIPVTPGTSYTVHVGRGGDGGWLSHTLTTGGPGGLETDTLTSAYGQPGEPSWFMSLSSLYADGGSGHTNAGTRSSSGGTYKTGGGQSGAGTIASSNSGPGAAGGGIGIYGGSNGGGGGQSVANGAGGGAGGYTAAGESGGTGYTANAGGGAGQNGSSGSAGTSVYGGYGGSYGGGGGAGPSGSRTAAQSQGAGGAGGGGAVRIIWGTNRSFPSTNTQDM